MFHSFAVSQFGVAPSRFTLACERLRGPRLPASFYSLQCYQFGSMLCWRLVLLGSRPACQWQQHRHYWSACTSHWYRIRCLVASDIGMTLSVADGLPCVVSLRPSGHEWLLCLLPSGLAHVLGHLVLLSGQPIFRSSCGSRPGATAARRLLGSLVPLCPATTVASAGSLCHRVAGHVASLPAALCPYLRAGMTYW